jgi:hypothetical protein
MLFRLGRDAAARGNAVVSGGFGSAQRVGPYLRPAGSRPGQSGVDCSAAVAVQWLSGDSCVVAGAGPARGHRSGDRVGVGGKGGRLRGTGGSPRRWAVRRRPCGVGCAGLPGGRGGARGVHPLVPGPRPSAARVGRGWTRSRRSPPPLGRSGPGSGERVVPHAGVDDPAGGLAEPQLLRRARPCWVTIPAARSLSPPRRGAPPRRTVCAAPRGRPRPARGHGRLVPHGDGRNAAPDAGLGRSRGPTRVSCPFYLLRRARARS